MSTAGTGDKPERRGKDRYIIWYLWFSGLVMIALIVVMVILVFENQSRITAQNSNNITQCRIANVTRAQDIAIWNQFLGDLAPPGTSESPKIKAELARINQLIRIKGHAEGLHYRLQRRVTGVRPSRLSAVTCHPAASSASSQA